MYITTTYLWDIDCNNDRIREGVESWSGDSLLFYTADTYTTKKKHTLISCDNSFSHISMCRVVAFFLFVLTRVDYNKIRIQKTRNTISFESW